MSKNSILLRTVLLFVVVCMRTSSFAGPIFPTRSFILAPAFRSPNDTTKGALFLREQGIWGNLARGYQSANDRFGWGISFGGIIQFVEWEHSMIYLTGDVEVLADTHNDISFNPRAIFWTEGFVYADKIGTTELSVGYIHRCHHDIDDLDNNIASSHQERTLIYGSAMAKAVWRQLPVQWPSNDTAFLITPSIQLDQYLIRQDDRIPNPLQRQNDISKLNTSISAGCLIDGRIGKVNPYLRGQLSVSFYDRYRRQSADARVEAGIALTGQGSRMEIFVGREHLEDDLNSVIPTYSNYYCLGFRFVGANIGL